jgi:hypothetical protein
VAGPHLASSAPTFAPFAYAAYGGIQRQLPKE